MKSSIHEQNIFSKQIENMHGHDAVRLFVFVPIL